MSFFLLFVSICVQRKKQKPDGDTFKDMYYYPVCWSYSDPYWYWESILFVRRSVFAFVFIVFDNNNLKMSIGILLIIYLYIYAFARPFKDEDVNILEGYLIGTTALIIFIDASSSDILFQNVTISLLVLFPLIWFIYFMVSRCKSFTNRKSAAVYNSVAIDDDHSGNTTVELCGDTLTITKTNAEQLLERSKKCHHLTHVADSSDELEP
eukprot:433938_1